ncbi:hypothetical protein F5X99DRAFT_378561 [Biscogniauxia marginata]|nr:hypothetical protein F5X99DRAFT_378561 [Biscogniauxia marginata]
MLGAVDSLLKDGLGLVELELGLEVFQVGRVATTVGTTTGICEVEVLVDDFVAGIAPIGLATAVLLGLLGVDTFEAVFGKELGQIVMGENGALGNAGVVLLVELV